MAVFELAFEGPEHASPLDFAPVADFVAADHTGHTVHRPAFWDGGRTWRVRFAPPTPGRWLYRLDAAGLSGEWTAERAAPLLQMSPGGRNLVWNDGRPFYPVADTAWALPYRATEEEALRYARDRKAKGFNASLLMTFQPDLDAQGPEDRTAPAGFARAFQGAPSPKLDLPDPAYFQHLDRLVAILWEHGIVPIHTPLFYGFGWKGLRVSGPLVPPASAARFARMLVARYGALPAMWLVGADGTGREPAVEAMGVEIHASDSYAQPTGIHYNPWQDNAAHLEAEWCDYHLCQTGHSGEHRPEAVAVMHARHPVRGAANGEPTYEGMGGGKHGGGAWQADEAWLNLMAGGTLGTWYGAGSLWQWKRAGEEDHWHAWCCGPWDWEHALSLEGSHYPGLVARALAGLDFADFTPRIDLARGRRCLAKEGAMALVYLDNGGGFHFVPWESELPYRAMDARTGEWVAEGVMLKAAADPWMGCHVVLPEGRPLAVAIGHRRF